jgi:hypothetical protein
MMPDEVLLIKVRLNSHQYRDPANPRPVLRQQASQSYCAPFGVSAVWAEPRFMLKNAISSFG